MAANVEGLMDVVRIGGEDDEGAGPVVVEEGDGSAGVIVHPLVIINISDHFTRIRAQHGGRAQTVTGILLGYQSGRQVELTNSFEVLVAVPEEDAGGGTITFDIKFVKDKLKQFKEVFPKLDTVGWYCTGDDITSQHSELHAQMLGLADNPVFFLDQETKNLQISESPVMLMLNPTPREFARELPLRIFEQHVEIVANVQKKSFVSLGYALASEEAERIGVDHIAKAKAGETNDESEVSVYLDTQRGAIAMLQQRIKVIRNYLRDVRDGKLPRDNEMLRQLSALCSRLPITTDVDAVGGPTFLESANDSMLVSYMAMVTKGCSAIADVLEKLPIVHDKNASRRRGLY
mmetsp:Transcript_29079/g.76173  ORF Transcript_29079/g.76173 Transcript_29079/m.76173 type:complete len:347 (-) Transcript_29079:1505-2545(-)